MLCFMGEYVDTAPSYLIPTDSTLGLADAHIRQPSLHHVFLMLPFESVLANFLLQATRIIAGDAVLLFACIISALQHSLATAGPSEA